MEHAWNRGVFSELLSLGRCSLPGAAQPLEQTPGKRFNSAPV